MELCFDGYWYDTPYTQLGSYCVNIACLYNLVCDWLRTRKSEKLKNTSTSYLLQLILMQLRVCK